MLIIVAGILVFLYGLKQGKICGKAFADSIWFTVLFAYIVTETCSSMRMVNRTTIVTIWICLIVLLLILLAVGRKKNIGIVKMELDKENRGIQLFLGMICIGMLALSAIMGWCGLWSCYYIWPLYRVWPGPVRCCGWFGEAGWRGGYRGLWG